MTLLTFPQRAPLPTDATKWTKVSIVAHDSCAKSRSNSVMVCATSGRCTCILIRETRRRAALLRARIFHVFTRGFHAAAPNVPAVMIASEAPASFRSGWNNTNGVVLKFALAFSQPTFYAAAAAPPFPGPKRRRIPRFARI